MSDYSVNHIAIIPDGNRRWARKRGKPGIFGHKAGIKAFEEILKRALKLNVFCVSFWGMSRDNFTKREKIEVEYLIRIFKNEALRVLNSSEVMENDVRVSIIGEWRNMFPEDVAGVFEKVIEESRNRSKHMVNMMLAYDGKFEMTRAIQAAVAKGDQNIDVKKYLYTKDLPPVDLVIRTGGEPHLSVGFMMWDVADAQLYFSDKFWPEFTPDDFEQAVNDYLGRERRFGA